VADEGCSKDTEMQGEADSARRRSTICVDSPRPRAAQLPAAMLGAPMERRQQCRRRLRRAGPRRTIDNVHRHFGGFIRPDLRDSLIHTSAEQSGRDETVGMGFRGHLLCRGRAISGTTSRSDTSGTRSRDQPDRLVREGSSAGIDGSVIALGHADRVHPLHERQLLLSISLAVVPDVSVLGGGGGTPLTQNFGRPARSPGDGDGGFRSLGLGLVGNLAMTSNRTGRWSNAHLDELAFTCAFWPRTTSKLVQGCLWRRARAELLGSGTRRVANHLDGTLATQPKVPFLLRAETESGREAEGWRS